MTERCYAYQDDEDHATRCIRPRGHADSHVTSRGACWPNLLRAKPSKPRHMNVWTIVPLSKSGERSPR